MPSRKVSAEPPSQKPPSQLTQANPAKRQRVEAADVNIVSAVPADAPTCADLLRDLVDAHIVEFPKLEALPIGKLYEAILGSDCSSDLTGRWRKWIKEPGWDTLVARDSANKIVAMVHYCPNNTSEFYNYPHAHIAHFVVSPGHRRRGYGRKLLRHVLNLQPGMEFRIATATTAAQGLWAQAGFIHRISEWREKGVPWYGLSTHRPSCYTRFDGKWRSEFYLNYNQRQHTAPQMTGDIWVITPTSVTLTTDPQSEVEKIVWTGSESKKKGSACFGTVHFQLTRGCGSVHRITLGPRTPTQALYGKQVTTGEPTRQIVLRPA